MEVCLENITFSYGTHPVLRSISCRFRSGAFHAILGPNGSGKTTLLDVVSGFLPPESGQVYLEKKPVRRFAKRDLSRQIALVSQSYDIHFPFTVKDVVLMGRHPYLGRFTQPTGQDLARVDSAMAATGIRHLSDKHVTEISGGEKQRCVLARALCQDTPVLLLDEAFSNLDISHTIHMMQTLKQLTRTCGKTIIAVLHDLNLASAWADTLVFMKNGRVVVQGDADIVFTESNIQKVFDVSVQVAFNDYIQSNQVVYRATHV